MTSRSDYLFLSILVLIAGVFFIYLSSSGQVIPFQNPITIQSTSTKSFNVIPAVTSTTPYVGQAECIHTQATTYDQTLLENILCQLKTIQTILVSTRTAIQQK